MKNGSSRGFHIWLLDSFGMRAGEAATEALAFFVYDTVKAVLLFNAIAL